jgi:methionine sulfoxide reductase heme-binding subunit
MATQHTATLATAVGPHVFWIISRAAGTGALVLSSLAVCLGLLMGGRLLKGRGAELRVTHEALSLATLATLAVHGLSLLGDGYLHPGFADISVPFLSGYKTLWTAAGIVSFWALLALALSFYARSRIGQERWRRLHRFTALAWVLGVAHSLGEGSDAGQAWFLAMTAIVVVPALVLLLVRHLKPRRRAQSRRRAAHAAPAGVR